MNLRIAQESDFGEIMLLIKQAKAYLKKLNIDQWQDGYPNEDIIQKDISEKSGYILTDTTNKAIIGYVCISFKEDENYAVIDGKWKSQQEYAVIHRITIDDTYKGQGLAMQMFDFAEKLCKEKAIHSIKIDTHEKNSTMKHILAKKGYEYCGIIEFRNCTRVAFEKLF